jgi:SAM-dependent methyltransferase
LNAGIGINFMGDQIISLHDWLETPPGAYLLACEQQQMEEAVGNAFGYHALQLGLPELGALETNRMPHRWLATETPHPKASLVTHFGALPFPSNSLDLVVLPHTLELTVDPHAALREVERVLVPEGRVVICGLNPMSLWGLRQRRVRLYRRFGLDGMFLPEAGEFIGYHRLRDWLRLLGLEVESGEFGCYRPALDNEGWLARFDWMDSLGARWWPILGAVYCVVAVKRVFSTTLINPRWRPVMRLPTAPATVANSAGNTRATSINYLKQTRQVEANESN